MSLGIAKVNVNTELRAAYFAALGPGLATRAEALDLRGLGEDGDRRGGAHGRRQARAAGLGAAVKRLGFIGLGAMGAPMARNLAAAGFDLAVFDADEQRTRAAAEDFGARAARFGGATRPPAPTRWWSWSPTARRRRRPSCSATAEPRRRSPPRRPWS